MQLSDVVAPEHYEELIVDSAITPAVAAARGYRTLTGTPEDRAELEEIGFLPYVWNQEEAYPGLLIPSHGADGTVRGHQFKRAEPRMRRKSDGAFAPIKYESPKGAPLTVDVPEYTRSVLTDISVPLWITEGMKKVDSLVSQGMAALGLTGVFNWRNRQGTLGDWEDIPLKGRPVVVCFDSDANGNRNVQLAMSRLGAWLHSKGVSKVHYLVVPAQVGETPVKGVDDYFAAGGDLETLRSAATETAPGMGEKGADFTDAFLVERLAEALEDQFCWASGLGWLRWNGRLWKEVSDVEPLEAVREWVKGQFHLALDEQRRNMAQDKGGQIAGWRMALGKSRLTALRDLSRGLLQKDATDFDGDPDLLTVLNGTVHLPSGRLLPFDPAHCITKSADADYRPRAQHPLWTKALSAIPEDMQEWYQDRNGQALSGYPVPDHTLVISHGSGANGKSTIVSVIRRTLGDYGVMVSDRVLMASPDAHPTELMDFRGARYAVMEETPEARHLNVQRLKTVLGTESIKARRIRQDPVEFLTSHSLFINTNYRPVVTETDHGTWRRLALMPWPFTFRKPGTPLSGPWEREGDPVLAYAANDAQVRAAALAWMVRGAQAWYARGRMMLPVPERVEKETRDWRSETDLILGFCDDLLRFDPEAFTQTSEMLSAFNDWAGDRGHRPWNDRTFASRFGSHDVVRGAKVAQGRFRVGGKQQRGWMGVEINKDGMDPWTGEREDPPVPEPDHLYDDGAGGVWVHPGPEETCTAPDHAPVVLGFDLETADADKLFTGDHEGGFVRLGGVVGNHGQAVIDSGPEAHSALVQDLNSADVIYGHNILGFDLLALAHHHGADYDALAAKAVDTMVLARLVDPPLSKGMPNGYYGLDEVAHRLGHEGKTDNLKALAKKYGGFDRIPVDDAEYNEYLRGDLAATKAVYEGFSADMLGPKWSDLTDYAKREMKIVALQNRMTLNGWAVDPDLLAERVAQEDAKRDAAVRELHERYGVPLAKPDRFKLKPKKEWPQDYQDILSVALAREGMQEDPERSVEAGLATRIPGEVYASPWATDAGREAIEKALREAGAVHLPRTKSGQFAMSSDALGDEPWYDKNQGKNVPGLLQVYGDKPGVRAIAETLLLATGARTKYAEIAKYVTDRGRVHAWVGAVQGSGRWAMTKPSITNMGSRGAALEERAVLVADPGHVLLACDLSQVDMRAVAALSQDRAYMELFQPGRDAHTEMAVVYFGDGGKESRQKTKAINHKFNYGGGVKSTAEMNGIPVEVVQQAYDARCEAYPRVMGWLQEVRDDAASGKLLDNGFGRLMRPDPERAHTQGPALMGQGAARDIMCESLLRLVALADENGYNVRPYLRAIVHDEVVLSVPEGEAELWAGLLSDAFTWEWKGVPILCEVSKPAFRWSECK